jgi:hypothetical protein
MLIRVELEIQSMTGTTLSSVESEPAQLESKASAFHVFF